MNKYLKSLVLGTLALFGAANLQAAVTLTFLGNNPRGSVTYVIERKVEGTEWTAVPFSPVRGAGELVEVSSRSSGSIRATRSNYTVTATGDFFQPEDAGKEIVIGSLRAPIATVRNAREVVIGVVTSGTISTPTPFSVETDRLKLIDETVIPGRYTYRAYATNGSINSAYSNEASVQVKPFGPSGAQAVVADLGELSNMSTRGIVGTGENQLIAGFSIKDQPKTVLIRMVGPTMNQFGLPAVQRPMLRLVDGNQNELVVNTGWNNDPDIARAQELTGAFPLPDGSRDAAVVVTLPPGTYTALGSPVDGIPGIGLAELYVVN